MIAGIIVILVMLNQIDYNNGNKIEQTEQETETKLISLYFIIKIGSGLCIILGIFLFLIYRKRILNRWKIGNIKILTPDEGAEAVEKWFKNKCAMSVTVQLKQSYYANVTSGEDKLADYWVTDNFSKKFILVTAPLSRGLSAILGGDIIKHHESLKSDDKAKIKRFSPKEASDPDLEYLKENQPEVFTEIKQAQLRKKLLEKKEEPKTETKIKPKKDKK